MRQRNHFRISITIYAAILLLVSALSISCTEPDAFSVVPAIEYNNIRYVNVAENQGVDSLILSFDFEDGDGDLGIGIDDIYYPFHDIYYVVDSLVLQGNTFYSRRVPINSTTSYPPYYLVYPTGPGNYADYEYYSDTDDKPSNYDCLNYQIDTLSNGYIDTVYIKQNETRYNIYVKIYRNRGEGFEEYDLITQDPTGCGVPFHGRFPIWDSENIGTSIQGTITYSMQSVGFELIFRNFPIKIEFYIYDRALNKSNVVETPIFTLAEITD